MNQETLIRLLEAILFVSSKPLKATFLAKHLQVSPDEVRDALGVLFEQRIDKGVVLISAGDTYQLATNPELTESITNFLNADLREKLTDAQLEVLAIISYRGNISKAEIEAIRGVNSQYALRQLLMRGLVEKKPSPTDQRMLNYEVTTEFLEHFGIRTITELPEFEKISESVKLPEKSVEPKSEQTVDETVVVITPPETFDTPLPQSKALFADGEEDLEDEFDGDEDDTVQHDPKS